MLGALHAAWLARPWAGGAHGVRCIAGARRATLPVYILDESIQQPTFLLSGTCSAPHDDGSIKNESCTPLFSLSHTCRMQGLQARRDQANHNRNITSHHHRFFFFAKGHVSRWLPMAANILGFNGVVHSVVGDVPVDSEASVVTSSISKICQLSLRICS